MANIASIILSVVAIWLALYFYHKSKEAEKLVASDLSEIKIQSGMLEKLTGKWMDRFTRYAVNPKPADETTTLLMSIVERSISPATTELKQPSENDPPESLVTELITCYILIHYYSAVTNVASLGYLPEDISQIADNLKIKELVESSNATFRHLDDVLQKVDQTKLQENGSYSVYCETMSDYQSSVKDTTLHYASKETGNTY